MAHLRNCILCGSTYDYCPRCDKEKPAFYLKYCGPNCKEISVIENKYAFNHLTKEEAADELKKLDLSKLESFNEKDKAYIKGILDIKEDVKAAVEEPVVEETEESNEEKTVLKFKRSYKKN